MSIYFSVQLVFLLTSAEAKICFLSAQEDADWYFLIRKAWKQLQRSPLLKGVCVCVCVCVLGGLSTSTKKSDPSLYKQARF